LAAQVQGNEAEVERLMREWCAELVCLCGCGKKKVSECDCGQAAGMRAEVKALILEGKSKEEVFEAMAKKYGSEVLGAPKREGINWFVWVVVPYLVPLAGAAGIGVLILRWTRRRREHERMEPGPQAAAVEEEYRRRLEEELKRLD